MIQRVSRPPEAYINISRKYAVVWGSIAPGSSIVLTVSLGVDLPFGFRWYNLLACPFLDIIECLLYVICSQSTDISMLAGDLANLNESEMLSSLIFVSL